MKEIRGIQVKGSSHSEAKILYLPFMKWYLLLICLNLLACSPKDPSDSQGTDSSDPQPETLAIFSPKHISDSSLDENKMSWNEAEDLLFFTRVVGDWDLQLPFLSRKVNGSWTQAEQIHSLDTLYNGCISPDGRQLIFCRRNANEQDRVEIFLTSKEADTWTKPINLTKESGTQGGYFCWLPDQTLYFYQTVNEGDIFWVDFSDRKLENIHELGPNINTAMGTEFSPYVDDEKKFLIFSRYLEGNEDQQGFFISYNQATSQAPIWGPAKKIKALPYGWGALMSRDQRYFYFTDGVDLFQMPVAQLGLSL